MKLVHLVYDMFMQTIFQMLIISKIHQGQIFIHIPVYLINFGRAVNDPRYDAETGDYANSLRLVSYNAPPFAGSEEALDTLIIKSSALSIHRDFNAFFF